MTKPAVPITRVPETTTVAASAKPGIRRYPKGHPKGGKFVPKDEILVTQTSVPATAPAPQTMIAYKGFNSRGSKDELSCRDHIFQIGQYYEAEAEAKGKPETCQNGFHACTNPFDVFTHYSLREGRAYGKVELTGPFDNEPGKVAAKGIKVIENFSWPHLMNTLLKYARENPNDRHIKDSVRINGGPTTYTPRWDFVTKGNSIAQQWNGGGTHVQMSDADDQIQQALYTGTCQLAFGNRSVQIGAGFQISHGYNCLSIQTNAGATEVHGQNSEALIRHKNGKVRGIKGTRVTFAPLGCEPITGIIGENNLKPMAWLGFVDTGVRKSIFAIQKV